MANGIKNTNYTIRQVIELSGVSEFTLRGWESRYQAIRPSRTPSGRRLYSSEDVLKVRILMNLVNQGHRISSIAKKSAKDLETLMQTPHHEASEEPVANTIKKAITSALQFEWDRVKKTLDEDRKKQTGKNFIFKTALPLIQQVNALVESEQFSIAQEHILSAMLKEQLSLISENKTRKSSSKKFLLAAPEGDFHEIGLLIAKTLMKLEGVEALYVGANVPKRELCETAIKYKANHVLVVSTINKKEGAKEEILQVIHYLDKNLPGSIALWFAGRNTKNIHLSLQRNYKWLSSFSVLEKELS